MAKQKLNYSEAFNELEEILKHLENNQELNLDVISDKVKRASELIKICKDQLFIINSDIEKMIELIDK
jgi:exodeoxyribonuclease VII small subunit